MFKLIICFIFITTANSAFSKTKERAYFEFCVKQASDSLKARGLQPTGGEKKYCRCMQAKASQNGHLKSPYIYSQYAKSSRHKEDAKACYDRSKG